MSALVYLDTETTGLDPMKHDIWEIAYAVDNGPIVSTFLPMDRFQNASIDALMVGNFHKRFQATNDDWSVYDFDIELRRALTGATLVGANPSFDAGFLRWGWWELHPQPTPWNYRMLDIEAFAMGALGYELPQGLRRISSDKGIRDSDPRSHRCGRCRGNSRLSPCARFDLWK